VIVSLTAQAANNDKRSLDSEKEITHKNDFIAFDINMDGFVDASEVRN
jgi:hypothetical protein